MTKYLLSSAAKSVLPIVSGAKIESPLNAGAANRILERCDSTASADTIDMPRRFRPANFAPPIRRPRMYNYVEIIGGVSLINVYRSCKVA